MSFLPIAERELRVAARNRATYRLRVASALVALIVGSGFLLLTTVQSAGFDSATLGRGLFTTLTWICFAAALSAGLFLTADCLSEERREGTLGFLFLTDLRGYDVVLGKLLATALRGACALLAVFPILAVTLLMGGVTGAQFWKATFALVNALFLSLTAGLFVSTFSRNSQKALAGTLVLLVVLLAGGLLIDGLMATAGRRAFTPILGLSSPGFLFVEAGAWGGSRFRWSLLANLAVTTLLLGTACLVLPRIWQDPQLRPTTPPGGWAHRWRFGSAKRRSSSRSRLLALNPVLWLGCRERFTAWLPWSAAALMSGGLFAILLAGVGRELWFFWNQLTGLLLLVLYLAVASQAARVFVEARRNGVLELLLVTPLTAPVIVQGQWRALLRILGAPLVLCLAVQLLGSLLLQGLIWGDLAATTTQPATTNVGGITLTADVGGHPWLSMITPIGMALAGTVTVAANLVALAWFGMWMGLNSRSTGLATLKTIAWVQVLPWFVISVASGLLIPLIFFSGLFANAGAWSAGPTPMMLLFPLLTMGFSTLLVLAKDAAFLIWARRKLFAEFRTRAAQIVAPPQSPPAVAPPPVLRRPAGAS